jgi:hypothetical protein
MTSITKKIISHKTEGFGKVLWELTLDIIDQKIKYFKKSKNPPHPNFIEGLSQIILTLDIFLETSSQESEHDDFYIKIYDAVHLENGEILRTSEDFQGKEWFSDVMVTPAEDQEQYRSDDGAWYGKVSDTSKFSEIFRFNYIFNSLNIFQGSIIIEILSRVI